MRLVIKEYLAKLKEKNELDLLLCDLLLQLGYITDNKPETGNRQYGVDIQAHKKNEMLLCVVKQGNIDRRIWNDDQSAIRQSIEEIKDVYLRQMTSKEKRKKIHIVVATNGVLSEAVRPNWEGFVEYNKCWDGISIEIELWNIDTIVDYIHETLLNEYLFTDNMQSLLRKALYFIGESDYNNIYFEQIIDIYISRFGKGQNKKNYQKEVASLYLATQMIAQYAADCKLFKLAIMVSEYLLIRYWKFLLQNNLFEKKIYIEWLLTFCKSYEKWNDYYWNAVSKCCREKDAFPQYNLVEQKVMLYEVVGYMASYAYYLFEYNKKKSLNIIEDIISLINNNQQFYYAPYDGNITVISILYRLLAKHEQMENINILLEEQSIKLLNYYRVNHKYPVSTDSFKDAIDLELRNSIEDYEASGMWGMFILWLVLLDKEELYNQLKEFLDKDLQKVTKCLWFLPASEEELFYDKYAMNLAGDGIAVDAEIDFRTLVKKMKFILNQYERENFSFNMYSFSAIEIINCRYYNYIPSVPL